MIKAAVPTIMLKVIKLQGHGSHCTDNAVRSLDHLQETPMHCKRTRWLDLKYPFGTSSVHSTSELKARHSEHRTPVYPGEQLSDPSPPVHPSALAGSSMLVGGSSCKIFPRVASSHVPRQALNGMHLDIVAGPAALEVSAKKPGSAVGELKPGRSQVSPGPVHAMHGTNNSADL